MSIDLDLWVSNVRADLLALADVENQKACFSGRTVDANTSPAELVSTIFDDDRLPEFVEECLSGEAKAYGGELVDAIDRLSHSNVLSLPWEQAIQSRAWLEVVRASHLLLKRMR